MPLEETVGRVLAEPVWAARSSPPFDAAAMDIAVRAEETIGATAPARLELGAYEVVDTGDLPAGRVRRCGDARGRTRAGGGAVELRAAATPYQHVRSIGEDVSAAELLPAGHRLRPVDVAAAARRGHRACRAAALVVAVIPTGDEIRAAASAAW